MCIKPDRLNVLQSIARHPKRLGRRRPSQAATVVAALLPSNGTHQTWADLHEEPQEETKVIQKQYGVKANNIVYR